MTDRVEDKVRGLSDQLSGALLTASQVELRLLALIDLRGAKDVLERCPAALSSIVRQWYDSAPKSEEEWRKQVVFDSRPGVGGMVEFYPASLTDEEIAARLRVITSLRDYFE